MEIIEIIGKADIYRLQFERLAELYMQLLHIKILWSCGFFFQAIL